jgi:Tfp pilus assembly protein FimT
MDILVVLAVVAVFAVVGFLAWRTFRGKKNSVDAIKNDVDNKTL